jgi:protein-L-isoaspartate(D-aspartate) O-methyltransferase
MSKWLILFSITIGVIGFQSDDFKKDRLEMVKNQMEERGIQDSKTLNAFREVKRHEFVKDSYINQAYDDRPLPIGYGQTISQPYIVAYMTEIIEPDSDDVVLEIGTGSGYQAAILSKIVDEVYTIEIIPELANSANNRLQRLDYENVTVKNADGYYGWKEHAPFDAIVVTAAAEYIPPPLIEQLKNGGKMIIPVGSPFLTQKLTLVEKKNGETTTKSLMPVRFVPFRRSE